MTPVRAICRLCGRPRPIDMPTCRDCAPAYLSRIRQRRAVRDAKKRRRAERQVERSVRHLDGLEPIAL